MLPMTGSAGSSLWHLLTLSAFYYFDDDMPLLPAASLADAYVK